MAAIVGRGLGKFRDKGAGFRIMEGLAFRVRLFIGRGLGFGDWVLGIGAKDLGQAAIGNYLVIGVWIFIDKGHYRDRFLLCAPNKDKHRDQ